MPAPEGLYVCSGNQAIVSCYDAKTGKPYFVKEKLPDISGMCSSGAGAAGRVCFAGRNGVTYVLKRSETFEVPAVNRLDDGFECSPAFVDSELYLKGKENLYCIATK